MSFPTASPQWLQEEFQEFLQQRYSNVKSQLSASEKERNELQVALAQAEKGLEASIIELKELRTTSAAFAIEVPSNEDENPASLKSACHGADSPRESRTCHIGGGRKGQGSGR